MDGFVHFRLTVTGPFQMQDHSVKKNCGGILYNTIIVQSASFILLFQDVCASIWKLGVHNDIT